MFKAKNLYLLIAKEVSVDSQDKMNSIIKIIEKFDANAEGAERPERVTIPVAYAIGSSWALSDKLKNNTTLWIRVTVNDPEGKRLNTLEEKLSVPKGVDKVNFNFNVNGLPATRSGRYELSGQLLSESKRLLAETTYPFDIELQWDTKKVVG